MNVVATEKVLQDEFEQAETGFTRLLAWLDDGRESGGETYLTIRRRLASYFERRGRPAADMLADETLDRIGRTLERSEPIRVSPPARYCYVVARFVLLEDLRHARRSVSFNEAYLGAVRQTPAWAAQDEGADLQALDRLERCLEKLKPEDRELIIEYYRGTSRERIERRRQLAARLGVTMNALAIRACRLRASLEECVRRAGDRCIPTAAGSDGPLRAAR